MSIPSKQIGWSNESNLLWEISKQMERLTKVVYANSGGGGNSTYKVYTALLTQRDIFESSGLLVSGTSYIIYRLSSGDDFTNVGFTAINVPFVATGTTPTNWIHNTEVYDYELTKPTAVVLENTSFTFNWDMGEINWDELGNTGSLIIDFVPKNKNTGDTYIIRDRKSNEYVSYIVQSSDSIYFALKL